MKQYYLIIPSFIFILFASSCNSNKIKDFKPVDQLPDIFPDYINVVIPPNIAPLNFHINIKADAYQAEITGTQKGEIIIKSNNGDICIPHEDWKSLLNENKGSKIEYNLFYKLKNDWYKYKSFTDSIASETIDSYLAYRLINTGYVYWRTLGIYQRNLENFDQFAIFENNSADQACSNCHSFCMNNPEKMSLHIRKEHPGTIIIDGANRKKLNTKSNKSYSPAGYPGWHPNGKLIAYSNNKINQHFTSQVTKPIFVSDLYSDIVVYNLETNSIITSPKLSTKNRENLPCWAPDGKWLYYISAPEAKDVKTRLFSKYSLCRIAFNPDSLTWGNVDTVIKASETGLSITFPRVSPDGKYVMFCMSDYGYFTVYDLKSDLYLLDIASGKYHKLEINTNSMESFHSWSNNSRWFVFSSKRIDNVYSRPYFAYIDTAGKVYKPFVMPQKDPLFYTTFLRNYNVPELIKSKVNIDPKEMRDLVLQEPENVSFDSLHVEAYTGATFINNGKKKP